MAQNMHDVPLAEGDIEPKRVTSDECVSKTQSLRRFLKMNKKGDLKPSPSSISDTDIESNKPKRSSPQSYRRFHLRLGSMHRMNLDNPIELDNVPSGSGGLSNNSSKISLRGTLSKYWNSIFKSSSGNKPQDPDEPNDEIGRLKIVPGKTTNNDFDDESDEENDMDEDKKVPKLNEEFHTLEISET